MNRNMFVPVITIVLLCMGLLSLGSSAGAFAIIAGHQAVADFDLIPDTVIEAIGADYLIFYGHTSHGSQIVTGINLLADEDSLYRLPTFQEYGDDLGGNGDTSWVPPTRGWLDSHPDYNMVMWSWCGGCSDNTEEGINIYLNAMNQLEQDYPNVTFIYMTGHLDGTGPEGNLYARNNQIRDYCNANGKLLFDFADIESYDPDGNYYPDESDACEWCYSWCEVDPCPDCDCAHSHCFNCYLKGKAWWWMMARIWGWNPEQDSIPNVVFTSPTQNELNVPVNSGISVIFDIDMGGTTINDSTFVVNAISTGSHQGTISYNPLTKTGTLDPIIDFDVGEVVTVVLTTGIKSSAGIPLQMDTSYVWSFTVRALDGTAIFGLDSVYPAMNYPRSLCASQLDGDEDIDLAVVGDDPGKVSILLNNGDGTFVNDSTYTIGWHPFSICAADFDKDGDNDLAVAKEEGEYMGYVLVLLNNGDGKFTLHNNYYVGSIAYSVFPGDLDGDGDIDLAIAEGFSSSNVTVLWNNGDGTFGPFSSYPIPGNPNSVFASDLDNDQDLDLVTANGLSGWVSVLLNDGKGSFVLDSSYASGYGPFSVFATDLDGDGDNDLATANHLSEYMGYVNVFLNNGDATFFLDSTYWTATCTYSIFASDLDGDSDIDLAVTNQMCDSVSVLLNNEDGTFATDSTYPVGAWPSSIFSADFDNDGDMDLATANSNSDNVSILLNQSTPIRGDANRDGVINSADIVYLINYLFKGGPAPQPWEAGDVNCDDVINSADVVYLINYLFKGGPPPGCP
jgi:hypothetical protein